MRALSSLSPIVCKHPCGRFRQCLPLCRRQIRLLVLGEDGEQENQHVVAAKQIDHPCTAALSASAEADTHLADTAGSGNHHTATRIGRDLIDDRFLLLFAEQAVRVGEIGRRFDDRLHVLGYYGIAVVRASAAIFFETSSLPPRPAAASTAAARGTAAAAARAAAARSGR